MESVWLVLAVTIDMRSLPRIVLVWSAIAVASDIDVERNSCRF
jgi:hypothetical protein